MHHQSGFSLLEVMVAGLVAVVGLAGTAALLLFSLAQTSAARDRTNAHWLASQWHETLRLSPLARRVHTDPAIASAFMLNAYSQWQQQVGERLAGGSGLVCRDSTPMDGDTEAAACDGSGDWVIKVFWQRPGPTAVALRLVLPVPV